MNTRILNRKLIGHLGSPAVYPPGGEFKDIIGGGSLPLS